MEGENSQQFVCDHEPGLIAATYSHQGIDHGTQHKRTSVEGREIESIRTQSSGNVEGDVASSVGFISGRESGGEQYRERVSSPEKLQSTQKNASTKDASPMFKPLPDSVLHTALQSPPKKLVKEPLFRPSPPSDEEPTAIINDDVLSLHSSNSDAASDRENAIVVEDMVASYDSLFTPPPVSDDDDATLPNTRSIPSQSKKPIRYVMTHVEVPPLRRPKSDYKDAKDVLSSKPRRKKPEQGQSHSSLLAALQAQMTHNSEIHDDEDMIVFKPPPKKKRKSVQKNAVAGPSKLPPPSDSARVKPKPKRRLIESSSSSDEHAPRSSSRAGAVSKGKGVDAARKRQKVTIDLTVEKDDEEDEGTPAASTTRHSPPRAASAIPQPEYQTSPSLGPRPSPIPTQNADLSSPLRSPIPSPSVRRPFVSLSPDGAQEHEGYQRLNLRFYQHPPSSIIHLNTRFQRQWLHDTAHAGSAILPTTLVKEVSDTVGASSSRRFPWGGLMGGHSPRNNLALNHDADSSISLDYTPLGPYGNADVDSDDSDADVPALELERQLSPSPPITDDVRPMKIDLAAELKKKKLTRVKKIQRQNGQVSLPSADGGEGPTNSRSIAPSIPSAGGFLSQLNTSPGSLKPDLLVSDMLQLPSPPRSTEHQSSDRSQTYLTTSFGMSFQRLSSPPAAPPYAIRRPLGDLGVFMHDYTARPPSPDLHSPFASSSHSTSANATNLAPFSSAAGDTSYPSPHALTLQQGPLGPAASSTTTMPAFQQSDRIFLAATAVGTSQRLEADAMFPSDTAFDGGLAALNESWMTTGQEHSSDYGYDTVDPTLIFGGFANDDAGALLSNAGDLGPSKSGRAGDVGGTAGEGCSFSEDDREEAGIATMLGNISKAGSLFSGRSVASASPARASSSSSSPGSSVAPLPTSLTSMDGSPSSQSSGFSSAKSGRLETSAAFDPVPAPVSSTSNGDKQALSAVEHPPARLSVTRYESSPLSDLSSLSDTNSVVTPVATQSDVVTILNTQKVEVVIVPKLRERASGWEGHIPDDEIYCHQCRTKNRHPKTRCACKAKYCGRCINVRPKYVQVLELGGRVHSCPRCEQWCTCTECCKKRGETYIRVRAKGTASNSIVTTPALSPRLPSTPLPQSPLPTQALTVLRPSSSHRRPSPADPGPSSQPASEPLTSTAKKKSRVFIGKVQPSWGLGKKPRTREIDPAPLAVWPKNPTGPCTVRYYVGSSGFLRHKQMRLESTDDLLAGLTSVASLEGSDPEDADDAASSTCHEDEPPANDGKSKLSSPALCQRDVARAISTAYESLGHTVILDEEFRL